MNGGKLQTSTVRYMRVFCLNDLFLVAKEQCEINYINYAAYSSGAGMFDDPVGIGEVNGLAVARILEAIAEAYSAG